MADFGNIEELKKMNQMIPDLKKYGFATFNDEAATLSQQILKEEIPVAPKKVDDGQPAALERHLDMFKQQVDQRISAVEATMKTILEKMNEMIKNINELEKKPKSFVASNEVPRTESKQDLSITNNQQSTTDRPKGAEPQKRAGNLEPGDIDVAEYFYCGKK